VHTHPRARPAVFADPPVDQRHYLRATAARAADRANRSGRQAARTQYDPQLAGGDLIELRAIYPCQAEAAEEIRALANRADTIDVMAVRGLGIIGLDDSLLRKAISPRVRLRMLLLNPESDAVGRRAAEIGESAESFAAGIRLAIARIEELSSADRSVEVYLYDQVPVWRIIKLDDALFVSSFTFRHEGHDSPIHRLEPDRRGILHQAFVRTVEQAFSCSQRIV
jgi:hypothetical protein